MDRAAILAEVTGMARSVFADAGLEVTPATCIDDVPAWDPMTHIALIVEAETRFDIEFQTAEVEDITTIGELVQLIQAKLVVVHTA